MPLEESEGHMVQNCPVQELCLSPREPEYLHSRKGSKKLRDQKDQKPATLELGMSPIFGGSVGGACRVSEACGSFSSMLSRCVNIKANLAKP